MPDQDSSRPRYILRPCSTQNVEDCDVLLTSYSFRIEAGSMQTRSSSENVGLAVPCSCKPNYSAACYCRKLASCR